MIVLLPICTKFGLTNEACHFVYDDLRLARSELEYSQKSGSELEQTENCGPANVQLI